MYKRIVINLVYIIILLNFFLPFVFAQESVSTQPVPSESRTIDAVEKIMQSSEKDIIEDVNRNVDENFGQLDERMMGSNKANFRRGIFALGGILSVVIFGYAYIENRIKRKYDINFYEKMIDAKISKSQKYPNISKSFYESITKPQFDDKFESPEKYFEKISDSGDIKVLKERIDVLEEQLELRRKQEPLYESINIVKPVEKKKEEPVPTKLEEKKPSKFKLFISKFKKDKLVKKDKLQKSDELDKKIKRGKILLFVLIGILILVVVYLILKYNTSVIDNLFNMTNSSFFNFNGNVTGGT